MECLGRAVEPSHEQLTFGIRECGGGADGHRVVDPAGCSVVGDGFEPPDDLIDDTVVVGADECAECCAKPGFLVLDRLGKAPADASCVEVVEDPRIGAPTCRW